VEYWKWGSGQNSDGAARPCSAAYKKYSVSKKNRSNWFLPVLGTGA